MLDDPVSFREIAEELKLIANLSSESQLLGCVSTLAKFTAQHYELSKLMSPLSLSHTTNSMENILHILMINNNGLLPLYTELTNPKRSVLSVIGLLHPTPYKRIKDFLGGGIASLASILLGSADKLNVKSQQILDVVAACCSGITDTALLRKVVKHPLAAHSNLADQLLSFMLSPYHLIKCYFSIIYVFYDF